MLDLTPIFKEMFEGIQNASERFTVLDDEHITDETTGLKYHLYSEWRGQPPKITMQGEELINAMQLTPKEGHFLKQVKKMLDEHFAGVNRKKMLELYEANKEPTMKGKLNVKKK